MKHRKKKENITKDFSEEDESVQWRAEERRKEMKVGREERRGRRRGSQLGEKIQDFGRKTWGYGEAEQVKQYAEAGGDGGRMTVVKGRWEKGE